MPGARASQCEHVFTCSQHDGAGLDRVLCVVREMDDDEATLRNAADNVATPPPWYDLCLYVHRNAVADSKKGLSRTMLAEAATGKSGNAAAMEGHRLAAAGSVLAQSFHVERLLVEVNLTRHLATIAPLPPTCYPAMVDLLLERGWSVKDTQAAVERGAERGSEGERQREQGEEKQSRHRVWRDQTKPHRGSSSKVCNRQSHRQQNQPRRCRARRQAGERAPWIA